MDMNTNDFACEPYVQRVEKPWGCELLFTPPEKPYVGKLLQVRAGRRLSLQVHDGKWETMLLLHGRAELQVDDRGELKTIPMQPGMGYSIVPGQRHRLIAVEDCQLVESSTPETGTTYRLEDDAGRGHETEDVRATPNRGWTSPGSATP
jgi:mannose-6-phosphate isomerase-like protein (cupin superfamily)